MFGCNLFLLCVVGMRYDDANFTLKNNFIIDSKFGPVTFIVYRIPKQFGIYSVEATFNTPNKTAQCALATAFYSEYTGVTEIVNL